ncbi:MAG: hypothetical protein NBKEAIPA_03383 [Nitrospirae bacterium]|nr:MAG: hypothetical protein UZ03_NOB001002601 [Nitrospira sp. OLB3]MBV6471451.1 hypothetical protein [Nitrospirota bacterium]
MRTLAHRPTATQRAERPEHMMGNYTLSRMLRHPANERDSVSTGPIPDRFGHDFGRIPVDPLNAARMQRKLVINKPGDEFEQEADRIADHVLRKPGTKAQQPSRAQERLQTARVRTGETEPLAAPSIVQAVLASPGQPLDAATRAFMEPRFGHSFANVRVHSDDRAADSAHAVGARAYTVGPHIVLGEQAPMHSSAGRHLLAHELAHTIQQGGQSNSGEDARGPVLQRDVLGAVGEALTTPFENLRNPTDFLAQPLTAVFDGVVTSNIAVAAAISVPGNWHSTVLEYAVANPLDGAILIPALGRLASFWRGGWIMSLQPGAAAMTLDDDVFVSGNLSLSTFVHELVHVLQYTILGKVAFLESYFGLSGATIAYRWATGQPLNVMRSSPHEEQAYNLQARFNSWYAANKGGSAGSVTV